MNLGNFSLSLRVADLARSQAFYEQLGFTVFHGDAEQGWLILKGQNVTIGLFAQHLEKNTMTFNPGWDANAQPVDDYTDVRDLQKAIKAAGIELLLETDETGEGPAHIMIVDPDGNPILIDQHR